MSVTPIDTGQTTVATPRSRIEWMPFWIIVLILAVAAALYVFVPRYTAAQLASLTTQIPAASTPADAKALAKELKLFEIDLQARIWLGAFQVLGGAALLVGLFFTWRNLKATQDKLDIDRRSQTLTQNKLDLDRDAQKALQKANDNKLLIDREGQITTRFNTATSQLGAQIKEDVPNVEARLGAIYALEWIGRDDMRLYWPVMEILSAYVRHNAPLNSAKPRDAPRTDVQATLTVLGRSKHYLLYPIGLIDGMNPIEAHPPILPVHPGVPRSLEQQFDLRLIDLRAAEFYGAHLERADFWGANLAGAKFWGAVLHQAKLSHANLRGANLKEVHFAGAELDGTDFTDADLSGAVLLRTNLSKAVGLTRAQIASVDQRYMDKVVLPANLP